MNPDWHDLIQRHMAGLTTAAEAARLQEQLKGDDALARLYLRYANLDLALEARAAAAEAARDLLTDSLPAGTRRAARLLAPLAAAALIACGWGAWLMLQGEPAVAMLLEVEQARWESSTLPTEPGSQLGTGRLRLAEGLARLRFAHGAEVTLEGPAELELSSPQLCHLHRGSLVAHVPKVARGFSVRTAHATLIDHGTDFGISADASGCARVHVMQGEVELRHTRGTAPLRLTTRQMTEITPEELLPPRPLEVEPRLHHGQADAAGFVEQLSTRTGRGAAVHVAEARTGDRRSESLLLLKHCAEPGYGRKVLLRFDLAEMALPNPVAAAQLTVHFGPTGLGYASHGDDARIAVYAVTDDADDAWTEAGVDWQRHPAGHPDAGRVDETRAERIGDFVVPRGQQGGSFSLEDPRLAARIAADGNRLLTLVLVRENRIEVPGGLVLGLAGNRHPTLPPPTLRLR